MRLTAPAVISKYVAVILYVLLLASMSTKDALCQDTATPFSLKISAIKSEVRSGAPVFIRINQTNNSDGDVDCSAYDISSTDMNFDYDVRDGSGKEAPKRDMSKPYPGSFKPCSLARGQTRSVELWVSWLFDMTTPDTYQIQIARKWSTNGKTGTVKSNEISVEVTK